MGQTRSQRPGVSLRVAGIFLNLAAPGGNFSNLEVLGGGSTSKLFFNAFKVLASIFSYLEAWRGENMRHIFRDHRDTFIVRGGE